MKISMVLLLVFSFSAWSQVRPPRPMPPRPVPSPRSPHHCVNGDLYLYNSFIHRFYSTYECRPALRDIVYYGKFCDYATLYNQNGFFIAQFNQQFDCRRALLSRP
jgi:hypothetical protein